jgi:hypothetical protein
MNYMNMRIVEFYAIKEHIGRGRLVFFGRGAKQTLVGVYTILRVYTGSLYYITCRT